MRRAAAAVAAALALAGAPAAANAAVPPGCAEAESPGGEWRSFGHDFSNTRFQDKEKSISPADVPLLSPAWTFSTLSGEGDARSEGDITGTPVVADGCLYVATNRGWVFALNADSGEEVWRAKLPKGGSANNTVAVGKRRCNKTVKRVRVKRTKRQIRRLRRRYPNRRIKKYRWVRRKRWERCGTVVVGATRTREADEGTCAPDEKCIGPYAVAFDQATGDLVWATPPLDDQVGADLYGSPVIFKGVIMLGVSGGSAELGDEADRYAFQGSMSFLGISRGRVLRKTWTIHPPKQPEDEFGGAGIWSTPAVDPEEKVAFVGSANPFKPQAEHPHSNAVLKFDVDRKSPAFGQIVGSYKGNVDEYFPMLSGLPCYDIPGNPPPYYPQGVGSCGDIDLDFGASPNLFTENGRKLVGAGQKSGVYHVFDARTMEPVRSQIVGPPTAVGGIVGSTAHDGQSVFGPVTVPGYIWSLRSSDASLRWIGPVADGAHWGPPVAVANGVVYTVDLTGFLDAYDARTGALLAKRPLSFGGSKPQSLSWGGVSVARNTIYATVGISSLEEGFVVALRPGGPGDVEGDVSQTVGNVLGGGGGGGGGEGGTASAIVAGPGAVYTTYATPLVVVEKGAPLSFVNLDPPQHDVVSDERGPDGRPVFQSKLSGLGEIAPVEGMDRVESGRQYGFFCSLHPGMRGTLIVR